MKNTIMQNILVPVDFSEYSRRITQIAGAVGATHKAEVTLLYVMDTAQFLFPENRLTPELLPELASTFNANLQKQAQTLRDTFDVPVNVQILSGCLIDEILSFVRFHRVDMIVSGIADRPSDSTTASASIILRLASATPCPVWGLVDSKYYRPLSGKAGLIRTKIVLHEPVKKVKIRRARSASEMLIAKSRMTEVPAA